MPSTSSASKRPTSSVVVDHRERAAGELARAVVVGVAEQRDARERGQRPPFDAAVTRLHAAASLTSSISVETVGKSVIRHAARAAR